MYRAWGIGLLLLSVVAGAAAAGAPAFGASAADSGEQGAAVRLAVRAPSVEDADAFTGALRALGGDSLRLVEQDADLVLALGEQAFRDALAADGPPVLGLAVPRRAADQLITNHCRCGADYNRDFEQRAFAFVGCVFEARRSSRCSAQPLVSICKCDVRPHL